MPSSDDIVLDEWERAYAQIRSGIKTLVVLGMEKGYVFDSIYDIWDDESDGEQERHADEVSSGV